MTLPFLRRQFLLGASSLTVGASILARGLSAAEANTYDMIIVGGGTSGLPAATFASQRGARVLVLEVADVVGGTLYLSTGQMSAAGTKLQKSLGIVDTPQKHFDDVMRISRGTVDQDLVRLDVENAADTFDWLTDNGLKPLPDHPIKGFGHEFYYERRYAWGPQGGLSILDVVKPIFEAEAKKGKITLKLETRARELLMRDGKVIGVRAEDSAGKTTDYLGRNVVLASGGYQMNPALVQELLGYPQHAAPAYPMSRGDGLQMALAAGGYARGKQNYLTGIGRVLASDDEPSVPLVQFNVYPERRKPWEIYVNAHGKRWVREDDEGIDQRERELMKQPDLRFWIVFDQAIFDAASSGFIDWSKEQVAKAFTKEAMFKKANTIRELAVAAGVDPAGLEATIAAYNKAVATKKDPDFGREHMPLPIAKPPFYIVRQQGYNVTSCVGIGVDKSLRVTRKDGSAIAGLYASGEILGSGQLMGNATEGGMMVTPALTFGRLLGQRIVPVKA